MWRITTMTHLNAFVIKISPEKNVKKVHRIYNSLYFLIKAAASNEEQCYLLFCDFLQVNLAFGI